MANPDPRIVPDQTGAARLMIYAGVPAGLLAFAAAATLLLSWGTSEGLCSTWLAAALPYCR